MANLIRVYTVCYFDCIFYGKTKLFKFKDKYSNFCRCLKFESPHDKINKMACAPSEDSDQPGHLPSLISLHCVLNGQLKTQAFFMRTAKTVIRLGGCPG